MYPFVFFPSSQICRNGVIQFKDKWIFHWPYRFQPRYWLNDAPMLAAYWAQTDTIWAYKKTPFGQNGIPDSSKWSTTFYHVYDKYDQSEGTDRMLAIATADVKNHSSNVDAFEATYVVVVTWERIYPYRGYTESIRPPNDQLYFTEVRGQLSTRTKIKQEVLV